MNHLFFLYFYLRSLLGSNSLIMAFNETKCSLSLTPRYVSPEEMDSNSPEIVNKKNRIRRLCYFGTYDQNNSEWLEFRSNYNILNESVTHFNTITQNSSRQCFQNR